MVEKNGGNYNNYCCYNWGGCIIHFCNNISKSEGDTMIGMPKVGDQSKPKKVNA
jgi:hypothetical protein